MTAAVPRTRRLRLRVVIVAVIALVAGGLLAPVLAERVWREEPDVCAGIGLVTNTSGATMSAAAAAFIRDRGGNPQAWEAVEVNRFRPKQRERAVPDLSEISVQGDGNGRWRVTGACV